MLLKYTSSILCWWATCNQPICVLFLPNQPHGRKGEGSLSSNQETELLLLFPQGQFSLTRYICTMMCSYKMQSEEQSHTHTRVTHKLLWSSWEQGRWAGTKNDIWILTISLRTCKSHHQHPGVGQTNMESSAGPQDKDLTLTFGYMKQWRWGSTAIIL